MGVTKTVLVTGATGFIGSATIFALNDAGWQITQGSRFNIETAAPKALHLDLSDPATIVALAQEAHFDAIVHLGAHICLSDEAAPNMFVTNTLSTGCLAYLANLWGAHLIYASTVGVHGVKSETIDVETPVSLDTAYAKSKWLGEELLSASNVTHCILRMAGVFGCNGPTHLGLNRAIDGAINGEPPLQIGISTPLRNYVYVKDVAQAIVYALQQGLAGTHLLAGHEVMSIGAMLQEICDVFLPGRHPVIKDGALALNQVIKPSIFLPKTRRFREALLDIQKECLQ